MPSSTSSIGRYSSYPSYTSSYPSYRSSSAVSAYLNRTTSLERPSYTRSSIGSSASSYYGGIGYYGSSSSSNSSNSSSKRSSALPPRPSYSSSSDSYRSSRSVRVSPAKSNFSSFSRLPSDSYLLRSDRDARPSSTRYRDLSASRDSGYGSHYGSTRDRSLDLTNGNSEVSRRSSLRRRESDIESEIEKVRVSERIRVYEGHRDSSEERLAERRKRLGLSPSTDTPYRSSYLSSKLPHSLSSEDNRRPVEENGNEERRPSVTELCRQYSSNLNISNGSDHLQELTGCSGGSGPSAVAKPPASGVEPSTDIKTSRFRDSLKDDTKSSSYISSLRSKSPPPKDVDNYKPSYWRDSTTTPYRSKAKERIAKRLSYEVEDGDSPPSRRRTPTGGSSESFSESNGLVGLRNIGNTCFLNSIIQCLSNTRCLMEYLAREGYTSDVNTTLSTMKGDLVRAFGSLLCEMWREGASDTRSPINTGSFKGQIQRFAPVFIGYAQHDAQEFLRKLLEGLHEDVNRVTVRPRPITDDIDESLDDHQKAMEAWKRYLRYDDSKIVDMFVGQLKSSLQCSVCGHRSVTFDPFWDLSLPIPSRSGQVKLTQCLDLFTKVEVLDGDESPTCSKCKERRKMTKSLNIQKFPKVLVLHLKRFSPHERWRGKLTCMVDFPLDSLDLSRYAACASISSHYRLIGVANHSGTALSGHYTAYCRHPYLKTWHEYNDSRVSSISSNRVCSPEAYVLFYELNCSY